MVRKLKAHGGFNLADPKALEDAIEPFYGFLFGVLYPRVPEATCVLLSCEVRTCHIKPVAIPIAVPRPGYCY